MLLRTECDTTLLFAAITVNRKGMIFLTVGVKVLYKYVVEEEATEFTGYP
jgi:hypothetical protein